MRTGTAPFLVSNVFAASMFGFFRLEDHLFMVASESGKLKDKVTVEHFHDMGKFQFGFTMFWSTSLFRR